MGGNGKDTKVPVKDVEKGLKEVCSALEKDLKSQKVDPKTAKAMRCAIEDASEKVAKAAKAGADKDKTIDPRDLDKAMKKTPKISFEIDVTQEEATVFQARKIKFKPKVKYKVTKDVSLSFTPVTVEYKSNKAKAYFTPTVGFTLTFP